MMVILNRYLYATCIHVTYAYRGAHIDISVHMQAQSEKLLQGSALQRVLKNLL